MCSSYQKQALTVMISPLCTNCHDITVILLNVALNIINLIFYLQRHIPTYLSIYIFMRIIDFIQFWLVIFLSWWVSDFHSVLFLEQEENLLPEQGFSIFYLPKASKYLYISLNISMFLPRASNSLYISETIDFQIAISWYVLYSISLSAQVYVHIQSCNLFLHIKSYVPYCSAKPPHTGLCPPSAVLSHINSYAPILQC